MSFDHPLHIIEVYTSDINTPEEMLANFYEYLQTELHKLTLYICIVKT